MAKISENKIWRIIARIDDKIIIKQASSVEKATRSARNAVCQRLCDSAGIEYELGWWKGHRHKARRDFVDNFLGTPLYVQLDDEVDIDLHEVPYEVYTIQQVRVTFRKMTLMSPDNIDAWGYLHWGPGEDEKIQLFVGFEQEEIIALSDAQECLSECPKCKSEFPFGTLILVTENFRLIPANCGSMIWLKEEIIEQDNEIYNDAQDVHVFLDLNVQNACEVIRIARENPLIYSILGNHEDMMLRSFDVENIGMVTINRKLVQTNQSYIDEFTNSNGDLEELRMRVGRI